MKHYNKIEINPEIMCGKPVIKATRVTVEQILRELSQGLTPAEITADHPTIKVEDVYMAQAYAADIIDSELLERFSEKLKMHLVVIDSEKFRFRKL